MSDKKKKKASIANRRKTDSWVRISGVLKGNIKTRTKGRASLSKKDSDAYRRGELSRRWCGGGRENLMKYLHKDFESD